MISHRIWSFLLLTIFENLLSNKPTSQSTGRRVEVSSNSVRYCSQCEFQCPVALGLMRPDSLAQSQPSGHFKKRGLLKSSAQGQEFQSMVQLRSLTADHKWSCNMIYI